MIKQICFTLVIFFALIGCFTFSTVFHEISHEYDFRKIAKNDSICALTIPTDLNNLSNWEAGYYKFHINNSDEKEYNRISSYTEYKSYGIDAIIFLVLLLCIFELSFELRKKQEIKYIDIRHIR